MTSDDIFILIGTISGICLTVFLAIKFWLSSPVNYPPGPKGYPVLGIIPKIEGSAHETFSKWSKEYGNVYSVKLGSSDIVVLNGYETIKEAMVTQGDKFCGRPYDFMNDIVFSDSSLGLSLIDSGPRWKDQRNFLITTLHKINPENKKVASYVEEETKFLIEALEKHVGKNMDHHDVIVKYFANIFNQTFFGYRVDYSNRPLSDAISVAYDRFCNDPSMANLFGVVGFFPFLRFFPPFSSATEKVGSLLSNLRSILKRQIEKATPKFDENAEVKSVTEAFLKRIKNPVLTPEEKSFYDVDQLIHLYQDVVVGGVEPASGPFRWSLVLMLQNPGVQEKLFDEIQSVLGNDVPTIEHYDKLHYVRACIDETCRLIPILPLGVPHTTKAAVKIGGFDIPKDNKVFINIWGLHHDPAVWGEDVETFRPERHLDEQGRFVKSRNVIMFSVGCRQCPGESLALTAQVLLLSGFLQCFKLSDLNPINPKPVTNGPLLIPGAYKVTLEKRKATKEVL